MSTAFTEIQSKGKTLRVPSFRVGDLTIIVTGKWLRTAEIFDEPWLESKAQDDSPRLIKTVKSGPLKADILTFCQRFDQEQPLRDYHFEWDNAAAIPITSFDQWWEKQIPQESRKNTRRATRMGVVVREVTFDDNLVNGIMGIYNADPLRQTGRFWHYGKSFDVVKKENSTYLDRSCILGAFLGDELIGFIKMVYVNNAARLMQIVAKTQHRDKRPMNLLVTKAVEVCEREKKSFLIYGRYTYGNKGDSSLTEFKRRTGFEKLSFPKYFVPLTLKGSVAIKLGLHKGLLGVLPPKVIRFLVETRRRVLNRAVAPKPLGGVAAGPAEAGADGAPEKQEHQSVKAPVTS